MSFLVAVQCRNFDVNVFKVSFSKEVDNYVAVVKFSKFKEFGFTALPTEPPDALNLYPYFLEFRIFI